MGIEQPVSYFDLKYKNLFLEIKNMNHLLYYRKCFLLCIYSYVLYDY